MKIRFKSALCGGDVIVDADAIENISTFETMTPNGPGISRAATTLCLKSGVQFAVQGELEKIQAYLDECTETAGEGGRRESPWRDDNVATFVAPATGAAAVKSKQTASGLHLS